MLANISLYWFTGAIGSSFWPYYARLHSGWPIPEGGTIGVPTGYAEFPKEILIPPRSLAEKTYTDIRRWTVMPKGGHFAALEQPEALARDVRAILRCAKIDRAGHAPRGGRSRPAGALRCARRARRAPRASPAATGAGPSTPHRGTGRCRARARTVSSSRRRSCADRSACSASRLRVRGLQLRLRELGLLHGEAPLLRLRRPRARPRARRGCGRPRRRSACRCW